MMRAILSFFFFVEYAQFYNLFLNKVLKLKLGYIIPYTNQYDLAVWIVFNFQRNINTESFY